MKEKLREFIQYLEHEVEDEDKALEYWNRALPYIGLIVVHFNSLEAALNSVLCKNFTDRTDATGLIVLNKMSYISKVELFEHFCNDFQVGLNVTLDGYDQLKKNLRESGELRNKVVHANWENTDDNGYTYVGLKMSNKGMHQKYVQFSDESMEKIIELFIQTESELDKFWDHRSDLIREY